MEFLIIRYLLLSFEIYFYSPNIACKVKTVNPIIVRKRIMKIIVVFGRRNKLKKGPTIVSIRPIIVPIKNLGNLKIFSQKVGI
jgi:hypothetical protein